MRKIIFILLMSLAFTTVKAQSLYFPKMWLGNWKGTLTIYNKDGSTRSLDMHIVLEKRPTPNEYLFMILYKVGDNEDVRHYTLIADTADATHFIVDEGNGIRINQRLFGTTLINQFVVQGQLLTAIYAFEKDLIRFRIISGSAAPAGKSGGKDNIPEVIDFDLMNFQEASLQRVP